MEYAKKENSSRPMDPSDRKYFDARGIDPEKVYTFGKPYGLAELSADQAAGALAAFLRVAGFTIERISGNPEAVSVVFFNDEMPWMACVYSFLKAKEYSLDYCRDAAARIRLMQPRGARRFMEVSRDE